MGSRFEIERIKMHNFCLIAVVCMNLSTTVSRYIMTKYMNLKYCRYMSILIAYQIWHKYDVDSSTLRTCPNSANSGVSHQRFPDADSPLQRSSNQSWIWHGSESSLPLQLKDGIT